MQHISSRARSRTPSVYPSFFCFHTFLTNSANFEATETVLVSKLSVFCSDCDGNKINSKTETKFFQEIWAKEEKKSGQMTAFCQGFQ